MDRGAWRAAARGSQRVGHHLPTEHGYEHHLKEERGNKQEEAWSSPSSPGVEKTGFPGPDGACQRVFSVAPLAQQCKMLTEMKSSPVSHYPVSPPHWHHQVLWSRDWQEQPAFVQRYPLHRGLPGVMSFDLMYEQALSTRQSSLVNSVLIQLCTSPCWPSVSPVLNEWRKLQIIDIPKSKTSFLKFACARGSVSK